VAEIRCQTTTVMCTVLAVTRRFSKELAKVMAEIDTSSAGDKGTPIFLITALSIQCCFNSSAIPFIAECVGWRPLGSVSEYIYHRSCT
jgi:hypothetical protein